MNSWVCLVCKPISIFKVQIIVERSGGKILVWLHFGFFIYKVFLSEKGFHLVKLKRLLLKAVNLLFYLFLTYIILVIAVNLKIFNANPCIIQLHCLFTAMI